MRHRPMNARQTAAFWIEHVLQFGGEHLKPLSTHFAWWQYFCLDTLSVLFLIVALILSLLFSTLKFILKIFRQIVEPPRRLKYE